MAKKLYILFIVVTFILLIIPFVGMSVYPTNETTENTVLAEWPDIMTEGELNVNYLSEMGDYFEDHFAFRPAFVTINALIRSKFQTGATDQVIVGTDDWLYFSGTLNDYMGEEILSDRALFSTTHNLKLMQDYVESYGGKFVVMIPPNKNSLYDDNMPYYYIKGDESNYSNFFDFLEKEDIANVNLLQLFTNNNDTLYYKRDSHWNTKGALIAYNALMECIGTEHETWANVPYSKEIDHVGDIDEMLYPLAFRTESDISYENSFRYRYTNEVVDNMDEWIETSNSDKSGSILMYRDSFGETILPFLANEFEKGYFSQLIPYNLTQVETYKPSVVVIEKAERNLSYFVEEAPIMEPLNVDNIYVPEIESDSTVKIEEAGSYLLIEGTIDERYLETDTEVFVAIRDDVSNEIHTYPAFCITSEKGSMNGYQLYIKQNSITCNTIHINVLIKNKDSAWIVVSDEYTL